MAFYLTHLPDGTELPRFMKMDFLIENVKGASYIGTTAPSGFKITSSIPKNAIVPVDPPEDFFRFINPISRKSNLVCIAEDGDHDAACWIDIPQQLNICSQPDYRIRHWLIIPDAHKMITIQDDVSPSIWDKIKGWLTW